MRQGVHSCSAIGRASPARTRRRRRKDEGALGTPDRCGHDHRLRRGREQLQAIFPNGLPASEEIIRRANAWLDEAEQLAASKQTSPPSRPGRAAYTNQAAARGRLDN
jgi:hypothetical protein